MVGIGEAATVSSELEHILSKIGKVDWLVIAMDGSKGGGKIDELELAATNSDMTGTVIY